MLPFLTKQVPAISALWAALSILATARTCLVEVATRYMIRTPFYERSPKLHCSAVHLIAIWHCLYSCHFSDLEIEDKRSSALYRIAVGAKAARAKGKAIRRNGNLCFRSTAL